MRVPARLHLLPVALSGADPLGSVPRDTLEATRRLTRFLAENAKSARAHLKAIGHPLPLQQIDILEIGHHPEANRIDVWLAPLLQGDGADAGLLSEAGSPGIADPGASIAARAHELGVQVVPWSGPCAPVLALMASGFPGQHFRFLGYLPQDREELAARIREVERDAAQGESQVFIETPYRNEKLFEALLATCRPTTGLCVVVELGTPREQIASRGIASWRALAPDARPALSRRPAVFVLGATAP